ncbi:hypothetical protein [Nocardioides sp.]|uniref:hypothetical protein n=1 Tax=Nocardioides sp. TaxID=35761 RepID=UPI0025D06EC1|nr:hypothetical protein [Nocardioides sp.]
MGREYGQPIALPPPAVQGIQPHRPGSLEPVRRQDVDRAPLDVAGVDVGDLEGALLDDEHAMTDRVVMGEIGPARAPDPDHGRPVHDALGTGSAPRAGMPSWTVCSSEPSAEHA